MKKLTKKIGGVQMSGYKTRPTMTSVQTLPSTFKKVIKVDNMSHDGTGLDSFSLDNNILN